MSILKRFDGRWGLTLEIPESERYTCAQDRRTCTKEALRRKFECSSRKSDMSDAQWSDDCAALQSDDSPTKQSDDCAAQQSDDHAAHKGEGSGVPSGSDGGTFGEVCSGFARLKIKKNRETRTSIGHSC